MDIHFASQSGSLGSAAGMPLVVITVPILANAQAGVQATITADPTGSAWNGASGAPAYTVSVTPGTVTVGGTLSVSQVSPVSNLTAGTVVRIMGSGFTSATTVAIAAVSMASEQVVGPQEIDVTLAGPADLGGKEITVANPDGTLVNFFAAPPATPLPSIGDPFDGVIPLLPTASYSAGLAGVGSEGTTFGRIVLANSGSAPVEALVQALGPVGSVIQQSTITIPPSGQHSANAVVGFLGSIQALAAGPLRMLEVRGVYNLGKQTGFAFTPFQPIAVPPLGVEVPYGANIQFDWVTGTAAPQSQSLTVNPSSPEAAPDVAFTVSFATSSGGNWLSVTPASGTTCSCPSPPTVTVTANPSGLAAGTYEGVITVTPLGTSFQPAGPPVQVGVGLTVTNTPIVNQIVDNLDFNAAVGVRFFSSTFSITPDQLAGPFTVNVLTDSGGNWLSATPTSGTTPAQITVAAAPGSLEPGIHSGLVTVTTANGSVFAIPSTLTVDGGLQLFPVGTANFSVFPGGPPPAPQSLPVAVECVANCPAGSIPYNIPFTTTVATPFGGNWLSASPAPPGPFVSISVNLAGLAPGLYTGVVTLTSSQTVSTQFPVSLNMWTGSVPALVASPPAISVSAAPFSNQQAGTYISVVAGNFAGELSVQATTASGGNWLRTNSTSALPGDVSLSIDSSQLPAGVYQGQVTLSGPGQKLDIPVTLTVTAQAADPYVAPAVFGSVLNAASGIQEAIAPGEIISIHGFDFTGPEPPMGRYAPPDPFAGVELLINGQAAYLLYAGPSQVNAIVPSGVAGQTSATVQLIDLGASSTWTLPVAPAAPGIFTLGSTGAGQAAVRNQNNYFNGPSNPAPRGSEIQIIATGIPVQGTTPAVSVLIGGVSAVVESAGPAPGEVAGTVQVNVVVPENAPTGPAVPIVLEAAGQQSQATATIAVQ